MNIYELTTQYQLLQDALEAGEDVDALIESVNDELEAKADGYARIIRNLECDIEGFKKAEESAKAKREVLENNVKRLKNALFMSMKATGKLKFKTDLFGFSVAKNGGKDPIVINEGVVPEDLPEELVKKTLTIDKEALRKYIEDTGDITYGYIGERGESLRIR